MSADTCAVLTAVFPLVLLAFIAERRNLAIKARRSRVFRGPAEWTAMAAIAGLALTVLGVQFRGLGGGWALVAWAMLIIAISGLFVLTGFHLASAELEEDGA